MSVGVWIGPPIGVGQAEADVVEQDDEDVRRVLREMARLDAPLVLRFLQRRRGHARRRRRREGQDGAVVWRLLAPRMPVRCAEAVDDRQTVRRPRRPASAVPSSCRSRQSPSASALRRSAEAQLFGRTGFSCGSPPSSMSKSGSSTVLPCAPRNAGCALIHSLGFCSWA